MNRRPHKDRITRDDYIWLLKHQCDRWGIPLREALLGKQIYQLAPKALVLKILYDSGFSLPVMVEAAEICSSGIRKLIRRAPFYEHYLVAWLNGEVHPKKIALERVSRQVPLIAPIIITERPPPRVKRVIKDDKNYITPSAISPPSKARLMGGRA